ncbi:MAG: hypothetical protein CUN52_02290 [Phototrophicales bacterium]|nr:MAG: hypothetical protein CUN52_02290 [Phototrophicales bacterium]
MKEYIIMPRIEYNGKTISYEVIFTQRKTVEIRVYPDNRVVVKAPPHTSQAYIRGLISQRAEWILKNHTHLATYAPPSVKYIAGEKHQYLGESYPIDIRQAPGKHASARLEDGRFIILVPDMNNIKRIKRALDRWYRQQAYTLFAEMIPQAVQRFNGMPLPEFEWDTRIFNGRWGSCGHDRKIMLNVYLIRLDKSLIEYVIVHELCHLFEMNHSPKYYALLEKVMPDYKARRKALKGYRLR